MRKLTIVFALSVAAAGSTVLLSSNAHAQTSRWGALNEIAQREWTTANEPRPRVTKFHWIEPGRVLEARHGFVSRLQFGDDKFADTVERFVLDSKTGNITITYSYEDGRPPLKAVMKVEADGSLVETFTDANGVKKRNIYKSPSLSVNSIERQELKGTEWTTLGTTRKDGLTQFEIAENARRAEEQRQAEVAQENARRAAAAEARRQAEIAQQRAQEEAAYEEQQEQAQQQAMQQSMPNPLQVLQGMAASMQQQNQQQQADFNRQMQAMQDGGSAGGYSGGSSGSYSGGSSGDDSGGAIIVSDGSEDYRKAQEEEQAMRARLEEQHRQEDAAAQAAMAEDARRQAERDANAKDCWGRPITPGSPPPSKSPGEPASVCPQ